jgi:hypothetical protein
MKKFKLALMIMAFAYPQLSQADLAACAHSSVDAELASLNFGSYERPADGVTKKYFDMNGNPWSPTESKGSPIVVFSNGHGTTLTYSMPEVDIMVDGRAVGFMSDHPEGQLAAIRAGHAIRIRAWEATLPGFITTLLQTIRQTGARVTVVQGTPWEGSADERRLLAKYGADFVDGDPRIDISAPDFESGTMKKRVNLTSDCKVKRVLTDVGQHQREIDADSCSKLREFGPEQRVCDYYSNQFWRPAPVSAAAPSIVRPTGGAL